MAVKNSFRNLVICLSGITLVCGCILALVYSLTADPIEKAALQRKQDAIASVLPDFATLEEVPASGDVPAHFIAYVKDTVVVGYAVNSSSTGFGGPIRLMVGFRPDGTIFDVSILEHSETPGLGAKCTDPAFSKQFKEFDPGKSRLSVRKDGGDVDAITASTITSRAFCDAVGQAVEVYKKIGGCHNE